MKVDLFTWGAQIVNFLILVALLRHFLYGRIVDAIDTRREKIASRWEEAENEKNQAAERAKEYEQKQSELENQRKELLAEAKAQADTRREELIDKARTEVDELRSQWHKALEQDQQAFMDDLRQAAAQEISKTMRRVLQDLADVDLQTQMVRLFVARLDDSPEQNDRVRELAGAVDGSLTVRTSFDLSRQQENDIREAVHRSVEKKVNIEYTTSSDLLCGIELRANGQKMAWSVQDYLDALDQAVRERLQQRLAANVKDESPQPSKETEEEEQVEEQQRDAE